MIKKILSFLFVIGVLYACKPSMERKELLKYLNKPENGLCIEKHINGVDMALRYKPYQLFVGQHLRAFPDSLRADELPKYEALYKDNLYLQLSLGRNQHEIVNAYVNTPMYGQLVRSLSFGMRDLVVLTTQDRDTLLMKDFSFTPTYGMATSSQVLLVFDKNKIGNSDYLKFQVKEMGLETGQVSFKIKTENIKQVPNLKYN